MIAGASISRVIITRRGSAVSCGRSTAPPRTPSCGASSSTSTTRNARTSWSVPSVHQRRQLPPDRLRDHPHTSTPRVTLPPPVPQPRPRRRARQQRPRQLDPLHPCPLLNLCRHTAGARGRRCGCRPRSSPGTGAWPAAAPTSWPARARRVSTCRQGLACYSRSDSSHVGLWSRPPPGVSAPGGGRLAWSAESPQEDRSGPTTANGCQRKRCRSEAHCHQ